MKLRHRLTRTGQPLIGGSLRHFLVLKLICDQLLLRKSAASNQVHLQFPCISEDICMKAHDTAKQSEEIQQSLQLRYPRTTKELVWADRLAAVRWQTQIQLYRRQGELHQFATLFCHSNCAFAKQAYTQLRGLPFVLFVPT